MFVGTNVVSSSLTAVAFLSFQTYFNMFIANSAWLLTRMKRTQIQLWSVVFQAFPFHFSSECKLGLHFLTQWGQSSLEHLLIQCPKCLMHFSAKLSEILVQYTLAQTQKCETLWHQTHYVKMSWVRSVLGSKCLRSEVSVHRRHSAYWIYCTIRR